jgi:hypothetical protein
LRPTGATSLFTASVAANCDPAAWHHKIRLNPGTGLSMQKCVIDRFSGPITKFCIAGIPE